LRLLLPMILQGARIIEEGKVRDARDIDLGAIFGLGFPARRGGLLWWADTLGASTILKMLESLAADWAIPPLLLELAAKGNKFHQSVVPYVLPVSPGAVDIITPRAQLAE
ncbi:MAG: hypothetical protein ACWGMZ_08750, partial [Thermoguttaceae bacterium]